MVSLLRLTCLLLFWGVFILFGSLQLAFEERPTGDVSVNVSMRFQVPTATLAPAIGQGWQSLLATAFFNAYGDELTGDITVDSVLSRLTQLIAVEDRSQAPYVAHKRADN